MTVHTKTRQSRIPAPVPSWMSRPDRQRTWRERLLCSLGVHTGPWVYMDEASCNQMRACRRCGKADMRMRHVRRWQYTMMADCDQTKVCARCGQRGSQRTKHEWGPTYTVDSDHDARRCRRCREVHEWSTASDD
jgi:hypothetical protein